MHYGHNRNNMLQIFNNSCERCTKAMFKEKRELDEITQNCKWVKAC